MSLAINLVKFSIIFLYYAPNQMGTLKLSWNADPAPAIIVTAIPNKKNTRIFYGTLLLDFNKIVRALGIVTPFLIVMVVLIAVYYLFNGSIPLNKA
jgi:hypothetical protein